MPILLTTPIVVVLPLVTAITSPGLIDRSSNRMMLAIRLPAVVCKPKPIASPNAPENTVNAVRLIPSVSTVAKNAKVHTTSVISFSPSEVCAESRPLTRRNSRRAMLPATRAPTSAMTMTTSIQIALASEIWYLPTSMLISSSASAQSCNCAFTALKCAFAA